MKLKERTLHLALDQVNGHKKKRFYIWHQIRYIKSWAGGYIKGDSVFDIKAWNYLELPGQLVASDGLGLETGCWVEGDKFYLNHQVSLVITFQQVEALRLTVAQKVKYIKYTLCPVLQGSLFTSFIYSNSFSKALINV